MHNSCARLILGAAYIFFVCNPLVMIVPVSIVTTHQYGYQTEGFVASQYNVDYI